MKLATFPIAGWSFKQPQVFFDALEEPEVLLNPEPDNPYDKDALAIHLNGIPCGYVPRPLNQAVLALIEGGYDVTATYVGVMETGGKKVKLEPYLELDVNL